MSRSTYQPEGHSTSAIKFGLDLQRAIKNHVARDPSPAAQYEAEEVLRGGATLLALASMGSVCLKTSLDESIARNDSEYNRRCQAKRREDAEAKQKREREEVAAKRIADAEAERLRYEAAEAARKERLEAEAKEKARFDFPARPAVKVGGSGLRSILEKFGLNVAPRPVSFAPISPRPMLPCPRNLLGHIDPPKAEITPVERQLPASTFSNWAADPLAKPAGSGHPNTGRSWSSLNYKPASTYLAQAEASDRLQFALTETGRTSTQIPNLDAIPFGESSLTRKREEAEAKLLIAALEFLALLPVK